VIINYDKNNVHSMAHQQFAFKTTIAQKSPHLLTPFILLKNRGKLSTMRRSPWHNLHKPNIVDSATCFFWRKASTLSLKLGCNSVVSMIEHTRRIPSKLNMLPPLDLMQLILMQTTCYNTTIHVKCGDYPSFYHLSKKLASITNKKERSQQHQENWPFAFIFQSRVTTNLSFTASGLFSTKSSPNFCPICGDIHISNSIMIVYRPTM
jgi:hypothetical protein